MSPGPSGAGSGLAGPVGAHRFYERLGFVASHEGLKLDLSERTGSVSRSQMIAGRGSAGCQYRGSRWSGSVS